MDEIEHVTMEEMSGGEEIADDFYEKIEAPKFVDLTGPDVRPEGDDRFWFCARVGCDQKHEEELDSEAIYKNFVLRVMAARSPSARLRRGLCRKHFGSHPKCPNTVPAKPSMSRLSRLAMISSIPQKAAADKTRIKAGQIISKQKHSTPKPKEKGQELSAAAASAKVLTTPKNKQRRRPLNPESFRSVQNPKTTTVMVPKDRIVAKVLVFHSPKKTLKLKRSVELRASAKKLCDGLRKLEISNRRHGLGLDHNKPVPSDSSRRALRGREVKSRVFNSLPSQKQKSDKLRSPGSLKKRVKGKEESSKLCVDPPIGHEVRDKEAEMQSLCSTTGVSTSEKTSGVEEFSAENRSERTLDALKGEENDLELKMIKPSLEETSVPSAKQYEAAEIEDKENSVSFEVNKKEKAAEAVGNDRGDREEGLECDNKENASASDNNRKSIHSADHLHKKKAFGKKETCSKASQKAAVTADKCSNGRSICIGVGTKYSKPKPTNPKPFRLRTDERGILKEANSEKQQQQQQQQHSASEKEEKTVLRSKDQHIIRMENGTSRVIASKGSSSATLLRVGDDQSKQEQSGSKRAKPQPLVRKPAVSVGATSCSKKRTTPPMKTPTKQLEAKKETSSQVNLEPNEVAKTNEAENSLNHSPFVASSHGRRPLTVPREPNFHSIHVPKSCTRRVASEV